MTERQTDHIYKAIEEGNMIITCESMACEPTQVQDDNPYKKAVLNNVFKEKDESPKMRN